MQSQHNTKEHRARWETVSSASGMQCRADASLCSRVQQAEGLNRRRSGGCAAMATCTHSSRPAGAAHPI